MLYTHNYIPIDSSSLTDYKYAIIFLRLNHESHILHLHIIIPQITNNIKHDMYDLCKRSAFKTRQSNHPMYEKSSNEESIDHDHTYRLWEFV